MDVLIVDDSNIIRERLRELLHESKRIKNILEASTIKAAKKAILKNAINIAIIDIKLDGESGIELLYYIKKHFPHITTVMLTNYPQKQFKVKSYTYGTDYFLDKSTDFDKVNEIVKSHRF